MSAQAAAVVGFDPLRDLRHRDARAARDCADWLAWLTLEGKAPRTLDAYEKAVAMLLRAFPDKAITEFTDGDVNHVLLLVPAPSRRAIRVRVGSFFRWAALMGHVERNPMDRVPRMKAPAQKVYDVFTEAEIVLLTALPSPDGALFMVLFDTGLRKSEARYLQWRHVLLERGDLVVYDGKGGKDRAIPLTHAAQVMLAELQTLEGLNAPDHLWYGRPGGRKVVDRSQPVGNARFHRWYGDGLEAAGVRYRNPHTTRHTFATRLLREGARLERVSMLMGHASIKTTFDLYAHLDLEDARADVALLDRSRERAAQSAS